MKPKTWTPDDFPGDNEEDLRHRLADAYNDLELWQRTAQARTKQWMAVMRMLLARARAAGEDTRTVIAQVYEEAARIEADPAKPLAELLSAL